MALSFSAGRRAPPRRWAMRCGSVLADVLVPELRVRSDEAAQQPDALLRGEVDDLDAALAQPGGPAGEVHRLADHHPRDAELPDQPAAVPARGQRRYHHRVAVAAPPSAAAEGVGLAVQRRILFLDATVATARQQLPVRAEERGPDRDAALREPRA